MKLKKLLTVVTFFFIILTINNNTYSIEPNIFVQSTVNRASQVLSNNSLKEEKIVSLQNIAKETVDIQGIGFYTLGKYRKNLNNEQKKEYINLFEQYFLKSFASRLAEYSNPEIEVTSSEKLNENYTMVSSVLISTEKRPEVNIDWRIYTKNLNNLKIRDLIIEGLSLVRTQKEEFASIIESNNGDINALLASLEKFIK